MKRVLIANRGEISLRVLNACRSLGIESVAVYSDADSSSLHVLQADRAVRIGPAPASSSYLNQQSLIHVAKSLDCDYIHPGYGFLSENASFAELCQSENVKFIGPSVAVLRQMGDKSLARKRAMSCGIPVVSGTTEAYFHPQAALEEARGIGFPVLIKARGGGGGKGMRVVEEENSFEAEFAKSTKEAQSAFGDAAVYIESFLCGIRHVEVQILGDQFGKVIALGERDCTLQRRHQKLLEESPCPVISNEIRSSLIDSAVRLASSIGYEGAGTVEFVLTEDCSQFFFIEMNTRIQVEHPVTELLYGIDLVEAQLRVARGERIFDVVPEPKATGHSMEFRINAEDWRNDFRPSPGRIEKLQLPAGAGIRVDTHVHESATISPYYDSMIAKLIIYGHNREHVLQRASKALQEFQIDGVSTTLEFHQTVLNQSAFRSGKISTKWVEDELLPTIN